MRLCSSVLFSNDVPQKQWQMLLGNAAWQLITREDVQSGFLEKSPSVDGSRQGHRVFVLVLRALAATLSFDEWQGC